MEDYRLDYSRAEADIAQTARYIVDKWSQRGVKIATAESCTGGMISAAITAVSGSSAVIELGVCSYSNRIKQKVLGVSQKTLDSFSEYSTQCAEEMAIGAMRLADADYGVSTTGVAGPSGGTAQHPVGEVCIAVCSKSGVYSKRFVFDKPLDGAPSQRDDIRAQAARKALMLLNLMIMTEREAPQNRENV